ncbi:MAG: hypothetical protein NWS06_00455 [Candidatus Nanopelagicales bacterium]|nr:hypothetical protein [Candidatus Nanopelagicales bacterium]MDP4666478.1 hypothetical protein [Candidatus Nanopelagicales bacterium]MDP4895726.1 hypothetical protein [Candidatus Nanopelagicales bacterium]MDP5050562.1 hypothetical protein [Candidatus Nanopelagicales bacterium]
MITATRRIWATTTATAILSVTAIYPVLAETIKRDDGDEPGEPMGTLNAILWFVVLPLAITGIITLLTLGPSWTSAAKNSTRDGYLDDPTLGEKQIPSSDRSQINY